MIRKIKIWLLKRKLKNAYWRATAWREIYDCGHHLATYMCPQILTYEREYDELLDRLAKLDPNTPKARFRDA